MLKLFTLATTASNIGSAFDKPFSKLTWHILAIEIRCVYKMARRLTTFLDESHLNSSYQSSIISNTAAFLCHAGYVGTRLKGILYVSKIVWQKTARRRTVAIYWGMIDLTQQDGACGKFIHNDTNFLGLMHLLCSFFSLLWCLSLGPQRQLRQAYIH
jgi:hypothetical protein